MIQIDMDMPKSCMVCPMCHDHIWCHAPIPLEWGESDVSQHMTDRPEWCPLKEQEEQKRKWLQNIADNQLANAPMDGCCLEQWNYQKGVYDGLQMAYDILTEGR